MTKRLIDAALAAADLFRDGDTPDRHEIRELVRAADEMAEHDKTNHEATCLMCAVRALTEGDPATTWRPELAGESVSGIVLRKGTVATDFGQVPFVDLWLGGHSRVRVMAFSGSLRHALDGVAAQIGDRLQVWYDGKREIPEGRFAGVREMRTFTANVQRGH